VVGEIIERKEPVDLVGERDDGPGGLTAVEGVSAALGGNRTAATIPCSA
jgi:hypothetical protein